MRYLTYCISILCFSSIIGCSPMSKRNISKHEPYCQEMKNSVVVLLESEKLLQCEGERLVNIHGVAIGQNGYGKEVEGDRKTPVGSYPLLKPQPSKDGKYHTYIHVAYPTPEQERYAREKTDGKQGAGGAIGIHGPRRFAKYFGWLNNTINWTHGCIAVKSDKKIIEIAEWVESNKIKDIHLITK